MRLIQIDRHPSSRQLKVFGVIWLVFFGIAGGALLKNGSPVQAAAIVWGIAVVVPAVGWIVAGFMRLMYTGMAYAAFPVGFVISYLIMVIVYYLVLTPIGLAMRLCGYDPMSRHFDRSADTYWCPREQENTPSTYFRQF